MRPTRVAFLAAGWSLAREDAHGTAIALQDGDGTVLVDAGGEVAKGLVRIDGLETLERVYFTHGHPDHTWGFPGLVHCLRFTDREAPLEVAGPASALARAQASLEALNVSYPFDIEWRELANEPGEDERARWAPLNHSIDTLGYRFDDVTVLGDTKPCPSITELARDGSLLVHEASHTDEDLCHDSGHSTPADAGEAATHANVDALALIHIHPSLDPRTARKASGFPQVFTPVDGNLLERDGRDWTETAPP